MIFNQTGRLSKEKVFMNGILLENVREYKYLGFIFTPSGEIETGLQDLRDRALKSYQALKRKMGDSFNQDIKTAVGLYDSMIKPILTYASDFWGCLKLPPQSRNPIEIMQMKVFKQILGVHKQTTNHGVLLELGKSTLNLECIKFGIKNWERIRMGSGNAIILDTYRDALKEGLPWLKGVEEHLDSNNLNYFYRRKEFHNKYPFIYKKLYNAMMSSFHEEALDAIKTNKLRSYALFKKESGMENYLHLIKNVEIRKQLTKFRISDHNLMIEKGRHEGLHKSNRFCPFCVDKVEDEIHFMLKCPLYSNFRCHFLRSMFAEYVNTEDIPDNDMFSYLMALSSIEVGKFVYQAFELRNFLIRKPKQID